MKYFLLWIKILLLKAPFKILLNTVPRPWLIRLSYWVRPFLILFYKGDKYTDPIDGKSFRRLLPYGYANQRNNVLSPSTLSLERHRLLWLYLKAETDFFTAPLKILHIAPEQAFYKRFKKQKNLNYLTADLHSPLADVKADICKLPFKDNCFDFILCNHVLEHIPEDFTAMRELYRVLKKGGTGIFQVPINQKADKTLEDPSITAPKERTKLFGQYDHVRMYGMDFFDRLQSVGFQATAVDFTKKIKPQQIKRFCIAEGELIPVCQKT